jgi:hypothetical protein
MPFRLDDHRAKVQFVTSAEMPSLIYRAVCATDKVSNTQYVQHAVCEALSRDLGIPLEELIARLPPPRGKAAHPFGPDRQPVPRPGAAGTYEEVR